MITLWPHWQRPFFILIAPIFIYLLWKLWSSHVASGSWRTIIAEPFQPWLLKGTSAKNSPLPRFILSLAALLTFLALLGPSWQHLKQPAVRLDNPLVIVLDLSPHMLANDIQPNRLESAKHKIEDILNNRQDAQTAMVVYSGTAHTVTPLSDDKSTTLNLLSSLTPAIMPTDGQQADLGIKKALTLFKNTQQQSAHILLITAGLTQQEHANIQALLAKHSFQLDILGVGTGQGAPITNTKGQFLRDNQNNIIISQLDGNVLQQLANSSSGYYSPITLNNTDLSTLHLMSVHGTKTLTTDIKQSKTSTLWQDQGYYLLLPLLLLGALSARKGWLFSLALLVLFYQPERSYAFEYNALWLNQNQQGQQLLKQQKPEKAAQHFNDPNWKAYSHYEAGNYQEAEKLFSSNNTANGLYNYGNTLARQGKYQEAITAWDKAISQKANFKEALHNKQVVEELLKKQQQSSDKDQNKDSSSQPQNKNNNNSSSNKDNNSTSNQQPHTGDKNQQNTDSPPKDNQQQANQKPSDSTEKDNASNKESSTSQTSNTNKDATPPFTANASNKEPQHNKLDNNQQENKPSSSKDTPPTDQDNKQEANTDNQADGETESLDQEQQNEKQQALKQWLRKIPDNPAELLRRKFYYEQQINHRGSQQ